MHQVYLDAIKTFEGFTPKAQWDYAQHTNGYGTRAKFAGEEISPAEADQRFRAEIAKAREIVERHAVGWDDGTKAALTSLTFNAGTTWIKSGLGEAVRSNDIAAVRDIFVKYVNAGGEPLPGLVARRLAEVKWIGNGLDSGADAAAGTAGMLATLERVPSNAIPRGGADARTGETVSSPASAMIGPSELSLGGVASDVGLTGLPAEGIAGSMVSARAWLALTELLLREGDETRRQPGDEGSEHSKGDDRTGRSIAV